MSREPYFSIVIPTHNRADLIGETLQSLQRQTFAEFECIVVDDGGSDDTQARVQDLNDSRFRYVWKEHNERGAARNRGAEESRGKYIYYLDSDDLLAPDALRRIHDSVSQECPAVVISKLTFRASNGATRFANWPYGPKYKSALLRRNLGGGCAYLRRDVALNVRFVEHPDFTVGEDWDLALRLAARYPFRFSPLFDRIVSVHGNNTMRVASAERIRTSSELLLSSLRADGPFMRAYGEFLSGIGAEMMSLAALHSSLSGERQRAAVFLSQSLRMSPSLALSRRTVAVVRHGIRGLLRYDS